MPQKQTLTILCIPINAVGHVNALAGTTRPFLQRGHRVVFLLESAYKGHLPDDFEEIIYSLKVDNFSKEDGTPGEDWALGLLNQSIMGPSSPEEKWPPMLRLFVESPEALSLMGQLNAHSRTAIDSLKPDLLITDTGYLLPAIPHSGVPWIHHLSISPQLYVGCEKNQTEIKECPNSTPPGCSGLPFAGSRNDPKWRRMRALQHRFRFNSIFNDHLEKVLGYPRYHQDQLFPNEDALLVVYGYPVELNYPEIRAKGSHWFNLEVFNARLHMGKKEVQLASNFLKEITGKHFFTNNLEGRWTGKWVYLSMGSMGSIDLALMKSILNAVSETTHKYIVSKGPRHAEYDLPPNCWGGRYLPQTTLLPLVDLVITHGGK